jgi:hypothetical protein
MSEIVVIPDTQVKPGVNTDHLEALGNYIVYKQPETIVHLGDHWDMFSLNLYDRGTKAAEGANYQEDIDAGCLGMERLLRPIWNYNKRMSANKKRQYIPDMYFLFGNHEERIRKHANAHPYLHGKLSLEDLPVESYGWHSVPFLEVITINNIRFSHYFVNPDSAKRWPFSSGVDHQLKVLGFSFVQGHRQGLFTASPRYHLDGTVSRGIIAGSFYSHDEEYQGPQGNQHWRGALILRDVRGDGYFSPHELELNWLLEAYY